jgi:LPXTG-motif cell wall-anchored protein
MKKFFAFVMVFSMLMVLAFPAVHAVTAVGEMSTTPADIAAWAVGNEAAISAKIIAEFDAQATAGFDFGMPWQPVKQWESVIMYQPFNGGDNEGNLWGWGTSGGELVGAGFIMYAEGASKAYALINEMSEAWGNGGHFNTVGFPIGNQFLYEGKIFQNFSKGFFEITPGNSASAIFHEGSYKHPVAVGAVSTTPEDIAAWAVGHEVDIAAKIVAEFDAKATAEFDFGSPWQPIKHWEGLVMYQPFSGGDHNGNLWWWGMSEGVFIGAGFIMYSEGAGQAYSLIDEMSEAWGNLGHFNAVGFPLGNQFLHEGKIYQNFSKGYLECTPGDSSTAVLHADSFKTTVPVGTVSETPADVAAWAVGKEADVAEKITAEFNAKATSGFDFGGPWQAVKQWEGVVMFQPFNGGDNEGNLWGWGTVNNVKIGAGFIMYSEGAEQAYSLINEMSEAWGNLGHFNAVGYPIENQFVYEGKIYQNFSKGYMVITPGDSSTAVLHADEYFEIDDETSSTDSSEDPDDESPETGDAVTAGLVLSALVGLAGAAAITVKRKR